MQAVAAGAGWAADVAGLCTIDGLSGVGCDCAVVAGVCAGVFVAGNGTAVYSDMATRMAGAVSKMRWHDGSVFE